MFVLECRNMRWLGAGLVLSAGCLAGETPKDALAPAVAPLDMLPPAADATSVLNRVDRDGIRGELLPLGFLSAAEGGMRNLITLAWEIPGGTEQYLCGRVTIPEDVYIRGFKPLSPPGTHHTALTVREAPNAPDGVNACDVSEVGASNVFGSGVGTGGKTLPEGVGVKLARGSQVILNLHLLNATDTPLRGQSGTWVETTTADQVRQLADGVAVGPLKLTVPPGRSVQGGVCTVDRDYTIYGLMPHMHQNGVHMRVFAQHAGMPELLIHDAPYDFDNQIAHGIEPMLMRTGDSMRVECTFENQTGRTLHFGESSNDEMCLAGVARYPAGGKSACPY